MRLDNLGKFKDTDSYIKDKMEKLNNGNKDFESLFPLLFSEKENILIESNNKFKVFKITYGECYNKILTIANVINKELESVNKGSFVGIYMENSVEWLEVFWSLLMIGYKPVLMNCRLPDETIENVLADYNIKAVISDYKEFKNSKVYFVKDLFAKDSGETIKETHWEDEILFMSSGTTNNIKLCAYTGLNFYYQICDSARIINECPKIRTHVDGELKLLLLLPFYHIFGFVAVYTWFAFFSRTFVLLNDLKPQTLLYTVKKHKVTHIFAVPLVWETIYKVAVKTIKARGLYKKFTKGVELVSKMGKLGDLIGKVAFKEVRDNIFGESVKFILSGGGAINVETLKFFNAIGYPLTSGYGMTEVGITSFESTMKRKYLNLSSIGTPLHGIEYAISENEELLIRGKSIASKIYQNKQEYITNYDEFFNTKDLVELRGDRYFLKGRRDDLIILKNGENLNPEIIEGLFKHPDINEICIFKDKEGDPILLLSIKQCYSKARLENLGYYISSTLEKNNLVGAITNVKLTNCPLLKEDDFKISRRDIQKRYYEGEFTEIALDNIDKEIEIILSDLEYRMRKCFANALQREEESIKLSSNFFTDLGGTSLDYFNLLEQIEKEFDIEASLITEIKEVTINHLVDYIKNNN